MTQPRSYLLYMPFSVCGNTFARMTSECGTEVARVGKSAAKRDLGRSVVIGSQENFGVFYPYFVQILLRRHSVSFSEPPPKICRADKRVRAEL